MRQRRRQQAPLQGLGDLGAFVLAALQVGEEAGVVERQGDAAGEDGEKCTSESSEASARRADADRQHPGRPTTGAQLDGDPGADAKAEEELEVLLVGSELAQILVGAQLEAPRILTLATGVAGDLLLHARAPLPETGGDRLGIGTVDAQGGATDGTAVFDDVDRAEVAKLGNDDPGDRVERLVQRQAAVGHPGDFVQQAEAAVDLAHLFRRDDGDGGDRHQSQGDDDVGEEGHQPGSCPWPRSPPVLVVRLEAAPPLRARRTSEGERIRNAAAIP